MKRVLLALLAAALSGCTMNAPSYTPSPTATGHWEGSIKKYTFSFQVKADLTVTDSPNPGDMRGTVDIEGIGTGTITGNVNDGRLNATNSGTTINCEGKFTENAYYAATCATDGISGSLTMYRQNK